MKKARRWPKKGLGPIPEWLLGRFGGDPTSQSYSCSKICCRSFCDEMLSLEPEHTRLLMHKKSWSYWSCSSDLGPKRPSLQCGGLGATKFLSYPPSKNEEIVI